MSEETLHLTFEPENHRQFGPCDCCGNFTERVWGYIRRSEAALAAYFVEWTPGHSESAANFDLIVGKWGEAAAPSERVAISLEFRHLDSGPAFRVIDASTRSISSSPLIGAVMSRDEVLGGEFRGLTFDLVDAIYLQDPRIERLRLPKT